MSTNKNYIPVDDKLKDFKSYLDLNDRCIFSARFGDGKSYFLSQFLKKHKKQYLFIPIYPVNYQVAENKDIFEYIKRDILFRLLASGEIEIDETVISNSLYLAYYLNENGIQVSLDFLNLIPDINLNGTDISLTAITATSKVLFKIKDKFKEFISKYKNDSQNAEKAIESFTTQKGSIYEFDIISQLICDLNDQYRKKYKRRKVVLLIEDLDRIDPAHIFRILNIFSAHFDRYYMSYNETKAQTILYANKFKFDKIISVCHYENIKNIYAHCYGAKTDFNGYIGKFSSSRHFSYSLKAELKEYILEKIDHDLNSRNQSLCNRLVDIIIYKYANTQEDLYGNIRFINSCLNQLLAIKNENIPVLGNYKISSINNLTKLLDLLYKFNIEILTLNKWINDNNYCLDSLLSQCWLIAPNYDEKIEFQQSKQIRCDLECVYDLEGITLSMHIKDDLITWIEIGKLIKDKTIYQKVSRQRQQILNFFNSFIFNSNDSIIKL